MSAVARLAEFVVKTTLEDCPSEAVARVRRAALDTLGVMLAGADEPVARIVRNVVRAEGGVALATVVGTTLKTAPGWAALANGAAGHAHDFDDTNFALLGHPSVPLLVDGPRRCGSRDGRGPGARPRLHHRVRDRRHPRHRAEPGSLYAGLARHLVDRHARLRRGGRAHHGTRPRPDAPRPRHRRLSRLRAQGELRLDDEALSRGPRRAERAPCRAARARGHDRVRDRARRPAGICLGLRRRRPRLRSGPRGPRPHLASPGLRHRGQALPVVRPDAFGDRRAHRSSRRAPAEPGRRRRGAGRRDPGRPRRARARAPHDRARAEVLDAVLRRRRARRGPSRLRLVHRRRGRQRARHAS